MTWEALVSKLIYDSRRVPYKIRDLVGGSWLLHLLPVYLPDQIRSRSPALIRAMRPAVRLHVFSNARMLRLLSRMRRYLSHLLARLNGMMSVDLRVEASVNPIWLALTSLGMWLGIER